MVGLGSGSWEGSILRGCGGGMWSCVRGQTGMFALRGMDSCDIVR